MRPALCAALVMSLAASLCAHHSVLRFDSAHALTLHGLVTEVLWNNPHTYIAMHVDSGARRGQRWVIESESPLALQRLGWTRTSVRAGDAILTVGAADRKGERIMRCQTVSVDRGRSLPCYPSAVQ
jgi:hypothetical protein